MEWLLTGTRPMGRWFEWQYTLILQKKGVLTLGTEAINWLHPAEFHQTLLRFSTSMQMLWPEGEGKKKKREKKRETAGVGSPAPHSPRYPLATPTYAPIRGCYPPVYSIAKYKTQSDYRKWSDALLQLRMFQVFPCADLGIQFRYLLCVHIVWQVENMWNNKLTWLPRGPQTICLQHYTVQWKPHPHW